MGLASTYVQGYGKIPKFFSTIRDGQAPEQFSQQLLKDFGFTSTADKKFIPLMKAIGFLSPDGKPTSRYHAYRDHSKSKTVMADALREVYGDIFLIKSIPTKVDKKEIQGKFKSFHNAGDRMAELMTNTFIALLSLADFGASTKVTEKKKKTETPPKDDAEKKPDAETGSTQRKSRTPALHYNIQIHLPATKDIEVFNAIFKSLKEHLFEI